MDRYTPDERLVSAETWASIRRFCIDAVMATLPASAYSAKNLAGPVAQFVAWLTDKGYDLDQDEIFTRANVDVWIATQTAHLSDGARGNYRTYLRTVCQEVGERVEQPFRPQGLTASVSTIPYSRREITALRHWARNQSTEYRRQGAQTLIAVCFGAGLSTEDIALTRGSDVASVDGTVIIAVPGRRPRMVPVLRSWQRGVLRAAEVAGEGNLFLPGVPNRGRNLTTNFVKRCHRTDAPHMSTQRARVTWIVGHLNRGVPLGPFLKAAGITQIGGLARYADFLDHESETAVSALQGSSR